MQNTTNQPTKDWTNIVYGEEMIETGCVAEDKTGLVWLRLERCLEWPSLWDTSFGAGALRITLLSLSDQAAIATVLFFKAITWEEIAVTDSCVRHYSCMVTKPYLKKNESLCRMASSERERKEKLQTIFSFFHLDKGSETHSDQRSIACCLAVCSGLLNCSPHPFCLPTVSVSFRPGDFS